ncbi:hypothetical protein NLG97_g9378 [Lecanicillium saksenae]|uniref:Uncharacterized protein n=1 Tax=Lecanicillium saksenae TaxID=468837 RepID=A0ACC1QG62_9HYPO|nr:hypothetical protein NLG97_g9378 [Lecanicillium saksenae]
MSGLRIGAAVDFGPAVVPGPDGSRAASGRVSSQYNMRAGGVGQASPSFNCVDQDDAEYWVQITASPQTWQQIIQDTGAVEAQGCKSDVQDIEKK